MFTATTVMHSVLEVRQNTRFFIVHDCFSYKNPELHVSPVSLASSLRRFPGVQAGLQEENGLQYIFEVYESVEK